MYSKGENDDDDDDNDNDNDNDDFNGYEGEVDRGRGGKEGR